MSKNKSKGHLYKTRDMVRSVLLDEPITSACGGVTKVLTRADVEAKPDKGCGKCLAAVGKRTEDTTITASEGWTTLLERVARQMLVEVPKQKITVRLTGSCSPDFPLAG